MDGDDANSFLVTAADGNVVTVKPYLYNSNEPLAPAVETWSETIPKAAEAGEYTMCYKVVGDKNINDIPVTEISATIAEAYTVTWKTDDGSTIDTTTVAKGAVPTHAAPAKDGFTFVGWSDGTTTYAAGTDLPTVTGDAAYTAVFTYSDGVGVSLIGHSISLDGDIGINFYMELAPGIAASETACMKFTIPTGEGDVTQSVPVKDARQVTSGNKTYYVFKCQVAAKEMTSEIKAQIIDGETFGSEYTYSVKEYADYLIAHANENQEWKKAVALIKATLNYGAFSQLYFDKNTGELANAGLSVDERKLGEPDFSVDDPVLYGLPKGTTFVGATLSLKSETTLSLYFRSGDDLSFSCEDYDVEKAESGNYQIVRIRGIKAKALGDAFRLHINGNDAMQYSVLNYCRYVLDDKKQDEKLQNAIKAFYFYYEEAFAYFD